MIQCSFLGLELGDRGLSGNLDIRSVSDSCPKHFDMVVLDNDQELVGKSE
jgi:hypothetical protein